MNESDIFPKIYQYKANTVKMIFAILFFGICAFGLFHAAQTTHTPKLISLWHIFKFELSAPHARLFFFGLSFMSLLFVLAGFYLLFRDFGSRQEILITTTSISHMKNHQTLKEIPIKDISSLDLSEVHIGLLTKNSHITIRSSQDKMVIADQLLESKKYLPEIFAILQSLHLKNK